VSAEALDSGAKPKRAAMANEKNNLVVRRELVIE
jgi:hypothetical protein